MTRVALAPDGALCRESASWSYESVLLYDVTYTFRRRAWVQSREFGPTVRTSRPGNLRTTSRLWKSHWHGRITRPKTDEVALVPYTTAAVPSIGIGVVFLDIGDSETMRARNAGASVSALDDISVTYAVAVRWECCCG